MYVRRKVFSNVEQPVEEQLYSVTMTEEQYNLFSEFLEERGYADADNIAAASAAGIGAATALGAAGYGVNAALKEEGGIKNVLKTNREARKAISAEMAAQAKADAKTAKDSVKGLKSGSGAFRDAEGNALKGEAFKKAKAAHVKETEKRLAGVRKAVKADKIAKANAATKEALKKGFEGLKGNKKALAIGGAGLAATGLAGAYAAGHNRK
jgi:hypothetical protein